METKYEIEFPLIFGRPSREILYRGKAQLSIKNWENLFGDQREDSLTSLEECF